jgi:choline kinase
MRGIVLAAGCGRRMRDLAELGNKVLLELGEGKCVLDNLLDLFETAGVGSTYVVVGHDAVGVRRRSKDRAVPVLNPFAERSGLLSSLWVARSELYASAFLLSAGDHYLEHDAFTEFHRAQPTAPILVHVELKKCDDEDVKIFVGADGRLRTISQQWGRSNGKAIGEFTSLVRFSPAGSRLFFDSLLELAWSTGLNPDQTLADVLLACHRRQPLAFHLSSDHRRRDIDYPGDYAKARELYSTRPRPSETELDRDQLALAG